MLRRKLRPLTRFALSAMLALALLPTVSHAIALARGGSAWAEVCTPQGTRQLAVADDTAAPDPAPSPAAAHLEHCPLCALSAVARGVPPASPALALPLRSGGALPPAFLHAPHTLHAWRSAQPRGPPSDS